MSRELLANEIFRRVESKGRTMAEYLRQEFPDIDVYSGIPEDDKLQSRFQDLRPNGKETDAYYKSIKFTTNEFVGDESRTGKEVNIIP